MLDRPLPAAADLYGDLLDEASPPRRGAGVRALGPGLLVAGVAALAAAYLSEHYGAPIMLMGLLLGLAFNFANTDRRLAAGLQFASTTLLRWGIVLVGLQVTVAQVIGLGLPAFLAVVAIVALVTATGALAARGLGQGTGFGVLAGGAVGICGASAALALASVLGERRATQAQLTLVLVTVSAASAAAMSLYPALAHMLHLSDRQAGFLMGAAIHDVAQALGAGYAYSPAAGATATVVKLTRVALLGPVLAVVARSVPKGEGAGGRRPMVPWFVLGFVLVCALRSLLPLPPAVLAGGQATATAMLLLAVTATGIRSPLQLLLAQGWRASAAVVAATVASFGLALGAALLLV